MNLNLFRRKLKLAKKAAQKGFTLIELAIVGLFLGLLAIFAITQFSGSATNTTKANGLYEASTKISDNWSLVAQSCGISTDITATDLTGGASAAADNLNMLLGSASASATYSACVASSGIRPLNGLATGGTTPLVQGYAVSVTNPTLSGRQTVAVTFSGPTLSNQLIIPLVNKYSSATYAASATAFGTPATGIVAATDTTDPVVRYVSTAGAVTLTLVKVL